MRLCEDPDHAPKPCISSSSGISEIEPSRLSRRPRSEDFASSREENLRESRDGSQTTTDRSERRSVQAGSVEEEEAIRDATDWINAHALTWLTSFAEMAAGK